MKAQDLVLNIAVNLGRMSRWALERNERRIDQFLEESEMYLNELENMGVSARFKPTLEVFERKFKELKAGVKTDRDWPEDVLTWANILTHRAKFA